MLAKPGTQSLLFPEIVRSSEMIGCEDSENGSFEIHSNCSGCVKPQMSCMLSCVWFLGLSVHRHQCHIVQQFKHVFWTRIAHSCDLHGHAPVHQTPQFTSHS